MDAAPAPPSPRAPKDWCVYALHSPTARRGGGRSYIGMTQDIKRRMRQHNGEIAGGAASTRGGTWVLLARVSGFPGMREALQFEWRSKRMRAGAGARRRAIGGLLATLRLDRWTRKSRPAAEMPQLTLHVPAHAVAEVRAALAGTTPLDPTRAIISWPAPPTVPTITDPILIE